jgi:hypothetical protein
MFIPDPDFSIPDPGVKKALSPGSGSSTLIEIRVSNLVGLNADPDPAIYLNADRIQAMPKLSPYFQCQFSFLKKTNTQYMLTKECPVHQAGRDVVLLNRVKKYSYL